MTSDNREIEVKYYLDNFEGLESRLNELGAVLYSARVLEKNIRLDTADGSLSRTSRVLRLRQDTVSRVTFKGPSERQDGARLRQELEFAVSNINTAQSLLEALGHQVVVLYEKYRTTYKLDAVEVTLDEIPYGKFCEIEGPDGLTIRTAAAQLGFKWGDRINDSYLMMFERVRSALGFTFRDLTFENFKGIEVWYEDLGL